MVVITIQKSLKFRSEFKDQIISGKKTTTIRLNKDFNEGDEVNIIVGNEIIGKAMITKIISTTLDKITDADAIKDGLRNKTELVHILKEIYGNKINDRTLYIIEYLIKK
ncbi:MAG: ASCH domain-containing protein [Thermoprotei archaeon]